MCFTVIVVDVNVIAYFLILGEHTEKSQALLLSDPEWAVPLLWRSEWRNILATYLRRGDLDLRQANRQIEIASTLVSGREYPVEDSHVLELAAASPCSAYDCEYVALAEALDLPLVTYDRQILEVFPGRAVSVTDLLDS